MNDIGQSATFTETAENIKAYRTLIARALAAGLKISFATITPRRMA